jgi:hypothetical protein
MADVTNITAPQFKGQRFASALVTLSGGANDTITSAQLLSMVTAGSALDAFLRTTTFANAAAVETAWAALAGEVSIRGVTNGVLTLVSSFAWAAAGGGALPTAALINAAQPGTFQLMLRVNHSITQ